MNKSNGHDFVAEGFHQLDEQYLEKRPPKITWSKQFREQPLEKQCAYLEKLANTMNHAAALIQDERDELGRLCELKEGQIKTLNAAMAQNSMMLQSEVEKMNEQRQEYHKNIKGLNERIRALENGDNG